MHDPERKERSSGETKMIDARVPTGAGPAKVLIVDDHPSVREGLSARISSHADLEVCGEVSDGPEAIEFLSRPFPMLRLSTFR
jgi:hypothetical protein